MAANSTQALGVVMFFAAVALLAAGLALGPSIVLIVAGVALLAFAISLFIKAKPLEKLEE